MVDEYVPDTTSVYPRFSDVMTSPASIYGNAYPETQLSWEQRGYPAQTALYRKFAPEMPTPYRGVQPTASLEQRLAGACGPGCNGGPTYTWHKQMHGGPCRDNYCNCCNSGTATEVRWCLGNKSGSPQPKPMDLIGRESFTVSADSPLLFWFFVFIVFVFLSYICRGINRITDILLRAHPEAR